MLVEDLESRNVDAVGLELDARRHPAEAGAGLRDRETAVLNVDVSLKMRILTGARDAHVGLQRPGHVRHLVGEALNDAEIDPRRLDSHIECIASRGLDVSRDAGRIRLQRAHRNGALRGQLHARRLLQPRVQHDPIAAVVRVRGQRLILEILKASVDDLDVPFDGRRFRRLVQGWRRFWRTHSRRGCTSMWTPRR